MFYPVLTAFRALLPNRVSIRIVSGDFYQASGRRATPPPVGPVAVPSIASPLKQLTTLQELLSDFSGELANLRLSRGLTLEAIAQRTKISRTYLQAIETRKYGLLPQGIYARSYLSQYAAEVAVSREALLVDYGAWLRSMGDFDPL